MLIAQEIAYLNLWYERLLLVIDENNIVMPGLEAQLLNQGFIPVQADCNLGQIPGRTPLEQVCLKQLL